MKKLNRIEMFATKNDTNKWVVAIDGYFGFVKDKAAAVELSKLIGSIEDSFFGCCDFLAPGFIPYQYTGEESTKSIISECQPINIKDFIIKYSDRSFNKYKNEKMIMKPAYIRFKQKKEELEFKKSFWENSTTDEA